jgi:Tol biopolymer transport system component
MGKLALVTILLAGVLAAGTAQATAPGKNGRIAFRRYFTFDRSWGAVFTVNPEGTDARQVTHPPKGIIDDQPDWAPDGSLLAFERCLGGQSRGSGCSVYTVNPDGSGVTRISLCPAGGAPPRCTDDSLPAFSPDGRSLVFGAANGASSKLVVIDLATHTQRVVVTATPNYIVSDPQFSPDGTRIVFEKILRSDGPRALFTVDMSRAHVRRLTAWTLNAGDNPDWSPDGRWILFRTHELHDGKQSQVDVIHPDGSGLRQLTRFKQGAIVTSSSFSPDGQWIVSGTNGLAGNADLYVMRTDGSGMHPITRTKTWESTPDWGPRP